LNGISEKWGGKCGATIFDSRDFQFFRVEEKERERTGIKSLKVKYNRVFGYFIDVTKTNLHLVPEEYIRKQTQANSERFITEELKEKESLVLGAQDKIHALEYDLFLKIIDEVIIETRKIQGIAESVASLDALLALSQIASENRYTRPSMNDEYVLEIRDGRHPVVERIESGNYVPNDTSLTEESRVHVITGPNMAGKSTYLRQVALITLLAQMGSFVPASAATLPIVDRIFTRVGAVDDLSQGQSTFMVEMVEVATIVNNATSRSLVIMDEVGRGTSTFDGLSLAWAITEYIDDHIKAKTLFATHYHQLNKLAERRKTVHNFNILVEEQGGDITFLRRIVEGGTDRSYGIHVAKLAGLPRDILDRAKIIQGGLEEQELLVKGTAIKRGEVVEHELKKEVKITETIRTKTEEKQKSLFEVIEDD
jgi:DNA mismatch repair protein MutS